ncbi:hypothetical protein [Vibrio rhizosphaerae]|uniref:Uncharacterized protein n=1 Tax=Vibrio rhizosphaerae TaxID=398736 RepID=A0ABU4J0G2_9VIBR|nr:hypothetical protein [Vibrio rhizosphaerae]MDW6093993.1 hypothetical protein [Vibrio rhizosphaerae]
MNAFVRVMSDKSKNAAQNRLFLQRNVSLSAFDKYDLCKPSLNDDFSIGSCGGRQRGCMLVEGNVPEAALSVLPV